MMLSNFHNSDLHLHSGIPDPNLNLWQADSLKYTEQQIGEMPKWIEMRKEQFKSVDPVHNIQTSSFSDEQKLAYDMIINHCTAENHLFH